MTHSVEGIVKELMCKTSGSRYAIKVSPTSDCQVKVRDKLYMVLTESTSSPPTAKLVEIGCEISAVKEFGVVLAAAVQGNRRCSFKLDASATHPPYKLVDITILG